MQAVALVDMSNPAKVSVRSAHIPFERAVARTGRDDVVALEMIDALQRTDLDTLRKLPDIHDAAASTSIPIQSGLSISHFTINHNQQGVSTHAAYYFGDPHFRKKFRCCHVLWIRSWIA